MLSVSSPDRASLGLRPGQLVSTALLSARVWLMGDGGVALLCLKAKPGDEGTL